MGNQRETFVSRHRRVLLFPFPFQGHINPMLQLANILYSKGFSITILDNYPEDQRFSMSTLVDFAPDFIFKQDRGDALREELELLLTSGKKEPMSCLITDAFWHFTHSVAERLKLPRFVLRTSSLYSTIIIPQYLFWLIVGTSHLMTAGVENYKKYRPRNRSSCDLEEQVSEFPLLKVKDILKIGIKSNKDPYAELLNEMIKQTKASSGIIWNSFNELEETELESVQHDFPIQSFLIPFPKYLTASSSSLLDQDRTVIHWLDKQPLESVLYVSFGSISQVDEEEFFE